MVNDEVLKRYILEQCVLKSETSAV